MFECPLDTKCFTHPRCWYCQDRCENCLKRAAILSPKPIIVNEISLRFCDEECQAVFHGPTKPIRVFAQPTRKDHSDTEKIEEGHSEICCIASDGVVDGEGLRVKISIRVGYKSTSNPQGRYYCIYNVRTLFTQQYGELFLHRDTSPDCPLPHVICLEGQKQVERLQDEGILQIFIQAGFRIIKRQYELGLAQAKLSEEIPTASLRPLVSQHQQLHSPASHAGEKHINQPSSIAQLSEIEEAYENLRQFLPGKKSSFFNLL